jgi:hypothetical protein
MNPSALITEYHEDDAEKAMSELFAFLTVEDEVKPSFQQTKVCLFSPLSCLARNSQYTQPHCLNHRGIELDKDTPEMDR